MAAFLDANVLVSCTDAAAPVKQQCARALVERLSRSGERFGQLAAVSPFLA